MSLFYSNQWHATCGNGCNAKIQTPLFTEKGRPSGDVDWSEAQRVYSLHLESCSPENPYFNDPNCFYGDIELCYGDEPDPANCQY